jgi:hypothetical protein
MQEYPNAVACDRQTFVYRTNLAAKTMTLCQTERRDEFTERLGCADKRMS